MRKLRVIPTGLRARLIIATAGKYAFMTFLVLLTFTGSQTFRIIPQEMLPVGPPRVAADLELIHHSTLSADVFQKFVSGTGRRMYSRLSREIVDSAIKYSRKYDLSPILVLAIVEAESQFYPFALSKQNAKGLMQINLEANQELLLREGIFKEPEDVFDPERNIEAGCFLLRRFIDGCSDLNAALDRYLGADSVTYKAEIHQVMGKILLLGITEELNRSSRHKIDPIVKVEAPGAGRSQENAGQ